MPEDQFPFTFPKEMKEQAQKIAKDRNCSIAQVIRDAISKYIESYEK